MKSARRTAKGTTSDTECTKNNSAQRETAADLDTREVCE